MRVKVAKDKIIEFQDEMQKTSRQHMKIKTGPPNVSWTADERTLEQIQEE